MDTARVFALIDGGQLPKGGRFPSPRYGLWDTNGWPAHVVANQTFDCKGPKLVVFRDTVDGPFPGLVPLSTLLVQAAGQAKITFAVERTLQPKLPGEASSLPHTTR